MQKFEDFDIGTDNPPQEIKQHILDDYPTLQELGYTKQDKVGFLSDAIIAIVTALFLITVALFCLLGIVLILFPE